MKFLNIKKNIFRNSFLFLSVFVIGFFVALNANAASLYFSPSSGSSTVGNTFKVVVFVSSSNVAMNSVELNVNFPTDLLSVVSTSKVNSILTFVTQESTFSNTTGKISFAGGLPTPGFTGYNGKILEIVFKAKKAGTASLVFSSSSVRANDGLGTNILQNIDEAKFTLSSVSETPVVPIETPATPSNLSQSPQVLSPTHPDSDKWYNNSNPKFKWNLTNDITAVRLLYDKNSNSTPTTLISSPISEKEFSNVKDGTFYFHVQLKNKAGWSKVSHFKFNIDASKPNIFNINEIIREDATEPQAKFIFDAKDEFSSIDYFEINLDDNPSDIWKDDGTHKYQTPILPVGKYTLTAKAFDKAGNFISNSAVFIIESIKVPIITEYPKELTTTDNLIIKGLTYSSNQVTIWLQKDKGEIKSFIVKSNENGEFLFDNSLKLSAGVYIIWADVVDSRGAKSLPSEKVTILVIKPLFFEIGSLAITYLTFLIPLIALLVFLILILWYAWHKYRILRKKIRQETHEIENDVRKYLDTLKNEMRNYFEILKEARSKRDLIEEEEKIIKQLNETLEKAEDVIEKEISYIERELK